MHVMYVRQIGDSYHIAFRYRAFLPVVDIVVDELEDAWRRLQELQPEAPPLAYDILQDAIKRYRKAGYN